jgi:integrase/recombinase XerD
MTTRAVQHIFAKYRKLTEIDHLTGHALRHTFAHEMLSNGTPMDVVARLKGHMKADGTPNLQMTVRYTLSGAADLARAVDGLSWV